MKTILILTAISDVEQFATVFYHIFTHTNVSYIQRNKRIFFIKTLTPQLFKCYYLLLKATEIKIK